MRLRPLPAAIPRSTEPATAIGFRHGSPDVARIPALGLGLLLVLCCASADDTLHLQANRTGHKVEVEVHGGPPAAAPIEFRLQWSADLRRWSNAGPKLRWPAGAPVDQAYGGLGDGDRGFFRVVSREATFTAKDGGDMLGFSGLLADEQAAVGNLNPTEFAERFAAPDNYLAGVTWDVATSKYWTEFQNPHPVGVGYFAGLPQDIPLPSLAFSPAEFGRITQLGFVATDRFRMGSFADVYYDVFRRDLPVFITTDSILHAWHRSYDGLLVDLELKALQPLLRGLLDDLAAEVPAAADTYGRGVLADSTRDADYYLTVARRLLDPDVPHPSALDQEARVNETLAAIYAAAPRPFTFFDPPKDLPGGEELVDFSQFIPRGHYTKQYRYTVNGPIETLTNYFRAVLWLGVVDLRVAGDIHYASARQLGAALVLHDLMQRAGGFDRWRQLDQTLNVMVGPADSMNLDQLGALLTASGLEAPAAVTALSQLTDLQARIETGGLGVQTIQEAGFWGSAGNDQVKLPRSLAFLGRRFTMDSWVLDNVTFDRLVKPATEPPELIRRRRPYSLDVAFAVFGNDQVGPDLLANMANPAGQPWRDGFPYQAALAAVRGALDQLPVHAWEDNVYNRWLYALRELSTPTTGAQYPDAMRTRAWGYRNLNTQLSSWTQLRHDTALYAKQAVTPPILCFYPYAFVDPQPLFFERMQELARLTGTQLNSLAAAAGITNKTGPFLQRFADTCSTLATIASKELAQEPLAGAETNFLANWIEQVATYFGDRQYNGAYPLLFYRGSEGLIPDVQTALHDHDSAQADFLVADVFTDGFSDPDHDPGGVLTEGLGWVNHLFIAINSGPDRMLYAGPVFSHYEFWQPNGQRLTDETWSARVTARQIPPAPPWVKTYAISGP